MKPTVHLLITVPDVKSLPSCTLALKSIRTGFPTADIKIHVNIGLTPENLVPEVYLAAPKDALVMQSVKNGRVGPVHLGWWIRRVIEKHANRDAPGPLYIVDGDCHFWESCEDWNVPAPHLYMGYYVPFMWNDFAKCPSFPRLHTSLLIIPDTVALIAKIQEAYPEAHDGTSDYSPCDPFMCDVKFINGCPYYWDCCSVLYQMIGGAKFTKEHLDCFEHLNSASFQDVMKERLPNGKAFEQLHSWGPTHMDALRGKLWPLFDQYYQLKHVQGKLASHIDA